MSARKYAQVRPLGPPPTTATRLPVAAAARGVGTRSAGAWSTA